VAAELPKGWIVAKCPSILDLRRQEIVRSRFDPGPRVLLGTLGLALPELRRIIEMFTMSISFVLRSFCSLPKP
jgi:hypothetical protein